MLNYIVRKPKKDSENPPLLILLHGYGSNEQDLFSFSEELPDEFLIISAQAPYSLGYDAYAWYAIDFDAMNNKFSDLDQAQSSIDKIASFIDDIKKKYKTSKTFVLGFSQGAILSYATSLQYPNKIDYVLALSGCINEDLLPETISKDIKTRYYISHGTVDQVLPIDWARKAPKILKDLGLECVYSEYPVGHGVAPQNFYHLRDWIKEHLK